LKYQTKQSKKEKEKMKNGELVVKKADVLRAMAQCHEAKEILTTIFGSQLESEASVLLAQFQKYPGDYLTIKPYMIEIKPELLKAFEQVGKPVPMNLYPTTTVALLAELFTFMAEALDDMEI